MARTRAARHVGRWLLAFVLTVVVVAVAWVEARAVIHLHRGTRQRADVQQINLDARLQVSDATVALTAGGECKRLLVHWRIEGFGQYAYEIHWVVTHDSGRAWTWKDLTSADDDHGDLTLLICPDVAGAGTSRFTVAGLLVGFSMDHGSSARGVNAPVSGHITARVTAA